jgi:hypothetical protein
MKQKLICGQLVVFLLKCLSEKLFFMEIQMLASIENVLRTIKWNEWEKLPADFQIKPKEQKISLEALLKENGYDDSVFEMIFKLLVFDPNA